MTQAQKTYGRVLAWLEQALRSGELAVGMPLPPERELAEALGISRNTVREALRQLEHMGFVVSSQGAGNFLCCGIQRNLQDSFELLMLMQQVDCRQLAELRTGLERQAALLAVQRITPAQAEEMVKLARAMAHAGPEEAARLDKQFHDTLAGLSGNRLILEILGALSGTIDRFIADMRRRILRQGETGVQLQYAHEQMADALARRDALQLTLALEQHFRIVDEAMAAGAEG